MKPLTKKLLDKVIENHDWREGQVWSWEACGMTGTDTCRVCGLTRQWGHGGQNSPDFDDFQTHHGESLTLREAADLPACQEE